jgi:hypothetical protein
VGISGGADNNGENHRLVAIVLKWGTAVLCPYKDSGCGYFAAD